MQKVQNFYCTKKPILIKFDLLKIVCFTIWDYSRGRLEQSGEKFAYKSAIRVQFSRWKVFCARGNKQATSIFLITLTNKKGKTGRKPILYSLGCEWNIAQLNWSYDTCAWWGTHKVILLYNAILHKPKHATSRWQFSYRIPHRKSVNCKCPLRLI